MKKLQTSISNHDAPDHTNLQKSDSQYMYLIVFSLFSMHFHIIKIFVSKSYHRVNTRQRFLSISFPSNTLGDISSTPALPRHRKQLGTAVTHLSSPDIQWTRLEKSTEREFNYHMNNFKLCEWFSKFPLLRDNK